MLVTPYACMAHVVPTLRVLSELPLHSRRLSEDQETWRVKPKCNSSEKLEVAYLIHCTHMTSQAGQKSNAV